MNDWLEPEERAIWQVLLDASEDDPMTVTEIAVVASVLMGRRVEEYVVGETVRPMMIGGYARRVSKRPRRPERQRSWAYWLTRPGRVRGTRLTRGV